jgi:hypothetical protein
MGTCSLTEGGICKIVAFAGFHVWRIAFTEAASRSGDYLADVPPEPQHAGGPCKCNLALSLSSRRSRYEAPLQLMNWIAG